jgi:hypothetical protein
MKLLVADCIQVLTNQLVRIKDNEQCADKRV